MGLRKSMVAGGMACQEDVAELNKALKKGAPVETVQDIVGENINVTLQILETLESIDAIVGSHASPDREYAEKKGDEPMAPSLTETVESNRSLLLRIDALASEIRRHLR